jgi:cysteine desulfurase
MSARTYLDWNATAPLRPEARTAMLDALDRCGNPSSVHTEGRMARSVIERAREHVAALAGAKPTEVVFTSGATEANATVLAGGWDSILVSAVEHDSIIRAAHRPGVKTIEQPVIANGCVDPAALPALEGSALVSIQAANGETGIVQPLAALVDAARGSGARTHCDATQIVGRMPFSFAALGLDFAALSSHKMGGPQGVGALIIRDGAELPALLLGGGQERRRRAGTENVAGIAGFGAAAEAARLQLHDATLGDQKSSAAMRDHLEALVLQSQPGTVIIGHKSDRLPNTTCLAAPGRSAELLVMQMDLAGIAVSAGSACSSGKIGASHVLTAMNIDPLIARSAIRISLGWATSTNDIVRFAQAWTVTSGPANLFDLNQKVQHARSA